ncbi:MAG: FtsQ-type POTRA domain-containing protein [Terracidiphilus sp.]|jgi:cell division protein FtsQ
MPLEFDDPDGDGVLRPSADRFGKSKRPWWRPAGTVGRVFLSVGALVVLGAFTTSILMIRHTLERDPRFRIAGSEDIQATGLSEVSRAEMMPVFGEDMGRNIFFVPIDARRKQLEQIPWIERATVMRVLPDQIRVAVVERQPVAFTRHREEIGLVDANGVLLNMAPETMAKHHYSFPVLTGIDAGDSSDSRKERMDVYMRMMAELDADGKHNSEQISEIDLTDPEDARVLMPEQGADILAHFGEDRFLERYDRFQSHIAEWRQQYPHLAAVDLRYDNQVVLEMASGKETAENASGDSGAAAAQPNSPAAASAPPAAKPAAKNSPAKSSVAKNSPAKKIKPAPNKKHAAPPKRADLGNTPKRTTLENTQRRASTTRPAATTSGSASRSPRTSPAAVAQGG